MTFSSIGQLSLIINRGTFVDMSTRVGRASTFVRNSVAAGIALVILTSIVGGIPIVQNAYADDFDYVINDSLSCEGLPLNIGTAVWHDDGDTPVCEIPLLSTGGASTLTVGSGFALRSLTLDTDVTLLNRGLMFVSNSATFHVLGTVENRLTIHIDSGGVMIIHPTGSFSENIRVLVDSTGGIINRGEILAVGSTGTGVNNGGQFFSDCNSSIVNGPIFGNQPIDICGKGTGTIAEATNQATGQSMFAGGRTLYGERFGFGSSVLFKTVDCATVELRKHGSPTGVAEVAFYDFGPQFPKKIFGTIDVSTLTTGYKKYEFCLPSSDEGHLVLAEQMLAVKYTGGDPLNRIDVRRSNVGVGPDFDGLASYHVNQDIYWHIYNSPTESRDLLFKLTNS